MWITYSFLLLAQHNLTASIVRIQWRDKVEKATRVIRQNSPTMLLVDAYKIGTFCWRKVRDKDASTTTNSSQNGILTR
jgi:hypothetical protein